VAIKPAKRSAKSAAKRLAAKSGKRVVIAKVGGKIVGGSGAKVVGGRLFFEKPVEVVVVGRSPGKSGPAWMKGMTELARVGKPAGKSGAGRMFIVDQKTGAARMLPAGKSGVHRIEKWFVPDKQTGRLVARQVGKHKADAAAAEWTKVFKEAQASVSSDWKTGRFLSKLSEV
jgi:hypothetical protein